MCDQFFWYYTATWAASRSLRMIYLHFWRMDTAMEELVMAKDGPQIAKQHTHLIVALVNLLLLMCCDPSQAKSGHCLDSHRIKEDRKRSDGGRNRWIRTTCRSMYISVHTKTGPIFIQATSLLFDVGRYDHTNTP